MVGAGTYCGKGGVGGLRGAERDGREGREGREGRVGGERAGEGQESKEKIGRLTFSLGAAPQGGRRIQCDSKLKHNTLQSKTTQCKIT